MRSASVVDTTIENNGKFILCGNGCSAPDCQHIAVEFTGRFILDRRLLPAIEHTTDTSSLTCRSDDSHLTKFLVAQLSLLALVAIA